MKYANWKNEEKSPASLLLDSRNPRVPPSPTPLTPPQLLEELVSHDDVYGLARNIAAYGFFPNEALIAVKEAGKLVVVEGNRRLAACKLLISPEAAPLPFQGRFKNLSANFDQNLVKLLPVLIAPSRESATPLLIARHTATQILRWEPFMQARFYYNLVQGGSSIDDVAARFGLKPSEIKDSLRVHNLYEMACRIKLPPATEAIVRNPRKFSLTTLDRIFETPAARKFFGVSITGDGRLLGKISPDEFKKGFSKVVRDLATGKIDSRKLNSPSDIAKYLDNFSPLEKPNRSKKGSFDSTTFLAGTPQKVAQSPARTPKKARGAGAPPGLIPRTLACNLTNARVRNLFQELRRLSPAKFPNACAFAFRCFLELSVFCFLDSKGEIAAMTADAKADIARKNSKLPPGKPIHKLPPHWTPNLEPMLRRIADPNMNIITQAQVTKALNKVINDEQDLFALNLFVHNPAYHPTEPRLRATWANLEEFFRVILS